jgi:hypothetical protein
MISILYVLIALGVLVLAMLGMAFRRLRKRRVWMMYGEKKYSYLDVDEKGGRVYPMNGGKDDCIGQIVMKDDTNYAEVYMASPDNSDYDGRKNFILIGTVNNKGEVRKGNDPEDEIFGYTANPDNPGRPSCEGKWRTKFGFKTYWELLVFKGKPDPEQKTEQASAESNNTENNENLPADGLPAENKPVEVPKEPPKRTPVAKCEMFRYPDPVGKDPNKMPDVVRAAAFLLLYKKYYDQNNQEFVEESPYGWKDTAFVSMLFYILIYLLFYSVYCAILEMPFIGQSWQMGLSVALFYFVLWGAVRQAKISLAESGISVQPWLDMLNSKVGISWITFVIWFFSVVSIVVCIVNGENNYELLPLQIVVFFGLFVNKLQKGRGISEPWLICDKYERPVSDTKKELKQPTGTIQKSYEWELGAVSKKECYGQISMFFDVKEMAIQRQANPFYMQRMDMPMAECIKEMYHYLTERNDEALHRVEWIAKCILDQSKDLTELERIQFIIDFVQEPNIKYCLDQDSRNVNYAVSYIRYPDETLFDKEGDADCKAFLATMIFVVMGYKVVFLHSRIKKHSVVAVCPKETDISSFGEDSILRMRGVSYLLCECTGDDFFIGHTISGIKQSDFETMVALPPENSNVDEE